MTEVIEDQIPAFSGLHDSQASTTSKVWVRLLKIFIVACPDKSCHHPGYPPRLWACPEPTAPSRHTPRSSRMGETHRVVPASAGQARASRGRGHGLLAPTTTARPADRTGSVVLRRPVTTAGPAATARTSPDRAGSRAPARAGATSPATCGREPGGDHPRVGGDDMLDENKFRGALGPPPRGRGRRCGGLGLGGVEGTTPAWAGTTPKGCSRSSRCRDHPRVGGDDLSMDRDRPPRRGPPPRGRGRLTIWAKGQNHNRTTPAWAGTTRPRPGLRHPLPDHPRVGGDDTYDLGRGNDGKGPPPRGRGRHLLTWGFPPGSGATVPVGFGGGGLRGRGQSSRRNGEIRRNAGAGPWLIAIVILGGGA